MGVIKSCT